MEGKIVGQNIQLWRGDCLELMKDIPDKSVDAIICDLPYGTTACKWDVVIPFDKLWGQYKRVIRPNGYIVLFGSQPFTTKLISSNIDNYSHQWIWNKGITANPLLCKKQPMKIFEDIIVFCYNFDEIDLRRSYFQDVLKYIGKSKKDIVKEIGQCADHCFRTNSRQFSIPTRECYDMLVHKYNIDKMIGFKEYDELNIYKRVYNPQMIKLSKSRRIGGGSFNPHSHLNTKIITDVRITDEQYPSSILNFSNRKEKHEHPTQKPVALIEYLIKTYSNEGDLILDNTAGSMTTAIAAINTNRRCICIEKDEHYFEVGSKRVKDHLATQKLF